MISYQPPSPVAPAVSAAFGAAQQYAAGAGERSALRGQQLQAEIAAGGAYNQGAGIRAGLAEAAARQSTALEGQHQAQLWQTQQNAFHEQAQRQALDQQMQARANEQHQQIQAQQMAMRATWDHADEMELNRIDQGDAWIDRQFRDGLITQDAALEMKAGVHRMKGPLQMQKEQAQINEANAQTQHLQQQNELAIQLQKKKADTAAMTAEQRMTPIYDEDAKARITAGMGPPPPAGPLGAVAQAAYQNELKKRLASAIQGHLYTDLDGKTHHIKAEKGTRPDGLPKDTMSNPAFQSIVNQEKARVDSYVNRTLKNDAENQSLKEWWSNERKDEKLAHDLRLRLGMPHDPATWDVPPTYEEYEAWKRYETTRPAPKPFAMSGVESPGQSGGPQNLAGGPQNPPSPAPKPPADPKPQPPITTVREATPEQQKVIASIEASRPLIEQSGASEEQKRGMRSATVQALDLLRQYGSPAQMPPDDRERYTNMLRVISPKYLPPPARPTPRAGLPEGEGFTGS